MITKNWSRAIAQPAKEFGLTNLTVLEGEIPKDLKGSLFRNGPARHERGGQKLTHWFDGDGAILGVHFDQGQASAVYQYVKTEGYLKEEKKGKFIYNRYDYKPGLLTRLTRSSKSMNAANTSVLPLPGKLLALWEGGLPHALRLKTLETIGIDHLNFLKKGMTFSAHPKVDPETGEIYNFGFLFGKNPKLLTYRCDGNGRLIKMGKVDLRGNNQIHDWVMAGKYLVIFDYATKFAPFKFLLGGATFHEALSWHPELGTEILIFDKMSMELVKRFTIQDAFYCFHFVNGYEENDGSIYIEFVKYSDFLSVDKTLQMVPSGKLAPGLTLNGKISSMRIDPKEGKFLGMNEISQIGCDFPTVADAKVGKNWRYTLVACHSEQDGNPEGELFRSIGRYDRETKKMTTYSFGPMRYVSEPIMVSSQNDPENGHILTVVYDAENDKSELWIHESQHIDKGPICKIALPGVIPPGFHGKWTTYNE